MIHRITEPNVRQGTEKLNNQQQQHTNKLLKYGGNFLIRLLQILIQSIAKTYFLLFCTVPSSMPFSQGVRSGEYGVCDMISVLALAKNSRTSEDV